MERRERARLSCFIIAVALLLQFCHAQTCNSATTCSNHGVCQGQSCVCDPGFTGLNCSICSESGAPNTYPRCFVTNGANNHKYTLVRNNNQYQDAWNNAKNMIPYSNGVIGTYLATITDVSEMNFIKNLFPNGGFWVGGADYNGQGTWSWMGGPDKPLVFYQIDDKCITYCNWGNNTGPTVRQQRGLWVGPNNLWVSQPYTGYNSFYLVEYGGQAPPTKTDVIFNPDNFHYYKLVRRNLNWNDANNAANSDRFQGTPGYLVTVTTAREHNFLFNNYGFVYTWLGASDTSIEGTWKWGKDNITFYLNGYCVGFCIWNIGEPNNVGGEDAMAWRINDQGQIGDWNDLPTGTNEPPYYVVEFDCNRAQTCNNHGSCSVTGKCICDPGYTGDFCRGCGAGSNATDCYIMNPSNGHGYKLVQNKVEFQTALTSAASAAAGGYLATITDASERAFIQTNFAGYNYWIAGTDYRGQGSWSWVAGPEKPLVFYQGSRCVDTMYCAFTQDTPKPPSPLAIQVEGGSGNWIPTEFTGVALYYLIETGGTNFALTQTAVWNPANSHFYRYVTGQYNWRDAVTRSYADRYLNTPGYLVTVTTPEEHNFLAKSFGPISSWIGASDMETEGTFKWWTKENTTFWSNGQCTGFCMWNTGEPNDAGGNEDGVEWIVAFNDGDYGDWNDNNINNLSPAAYIVEYDCARDTTCGGRGDCKPDGTCTCDVGFSGPYCTNCTQGGTYPFCWIMAGNGHGYMLFRTNVDFLTAWSRACNGNCGTAGGPYLATITSQDEANFIQNTFTPTQSYWIGGADYNSQGVFNWISGPEKPLVFFWNGAVDGQYNNFQPAPTGRSTRGVLVDSQGRWSGAAQTTQAWFLAEVGGTRPIRNTGVVYNQANNHFYKVVPQQGITWTDANNNANNDYFQDTRGYLATVTTPQEHNFLYQSFGILYVWIGGSDTVTEGVWKWGKEDVAFWQNGACVDGAFCLWNNGEPNNVNNEDALVWDINPTNRGDWNDLGVGDRGVREYIVEYECARATTCGNHGSCITSGTLAGTCQCDAGYTGSFCRGCDSTRTRTDCFIMDPISNHGYQLVSTATDWRSAWNAARNNFGVGSYLVSITSALETNFLRTTFPGITFWAGGADANNQGPWNWVTGPDKPIVFWFNGSCVIDQYCNFGGTPPLGGSAQGLLVDGSGAWIPTNTTASYPYILEIGGSVPTPLNVEAVYNPDNNHFYKLQWSQGTTWDNARTNAINNIFQGTNGYMATITTPQEHNFLYTSFGYMYTWLGASDLENEGTWKWVTKENTTFFQGGRCVGFCLWNLGEPNNVGDEDALVWDLYQGNVGDWNDQARGNNGVWQTLIEFDCGRDTTCGGHGDCTAAGICKCDPGYGGDFCRTCTGGAGTWPTCFLVNPADGHGYFYINGSWDYLTAWNRAFSQHGSGAYLATITSLAEQNFIMSHFAAANFWVAGADWDGQGTWAWTAGPENSMVFYHTSTGCLTTMYCNWRANPPLDRNPSKGILIDNRGNWVPTNFTSGRGGYLVEIGGTVPQRTKDIIFNPTNMHFYKFVSNYLTWDQALATAAQDNFMDTPGYLLTVTDPYENNFLFQNFGYLYSHIGGSDKDVEGTWRWTSNGNQIFWTGGQCTSFCMWGLGEPNDQGPQNEDIMTWIVEANRINYWNDLRADVLSPPVYVVEFDCTREHTCGGHGVCNTAGTCTCDQGYSGDFCRSCATSTNTQGCFVTNPANGHSYMLVSTSMEFQAAWSAAARNYGSSAYLATITDSAEMNFIRTTFAGKSFWVSGADYRGQGTWQWLAGPDKPLVFWTVQSSCTPGMFCGWTNGPTTRTPGALMIDASGNWVNQAFTGFRTNYLVEMGGAFPNNTGIAYNSVNRHFYRFVNQGVSWNNAMTSSAVSTYQDTPGYLVTVTTPQEFNFIYKSFGTFYSHIGASDRVTEGRWVWESNPTEAVNPFWQNNVCLTFCVWGLGEPNEAGGEDGSTWIIEQNRMNDWNDLSVDGGAGSYIVEYDCSRATTCGGHGDCTDAGVCQCDNGYSGPFCRTCADSTSNSGCAIAFNGHQYKLVSSPLSFQAAYNAAKQLGGGWYLATITSQAEADFIRTTYGSGNFWIGAADYRGQGTWSWITGPEKPTVFYHVQFACIENQFCGTFSSLSPPARAVQAVMLDGTHNWIPQPWTGVSASGGYLVELGGSYPVPTYDVVFNAANKHFYQIIDARISWDLARQQANENAFMGTPGYLATIGTPQEHNFLYSKFGNLYGWIGGSDSVTEGTWRWVTGDNSIFFQNGQCVGFCMWNVGEPNNVNNEDALVWTVDPNTMGDWNDLQPNDLNSGVRQYIVEYDCDRLTTCGGHGDCNTDGKCTCDNGFTGDFCRSCSSAGTYPGCFITDTTTNHSYMIIQGNWRWQDAWNDATNSKYGNAYFASITSDAERDFVSRTFPGLSYWISGADFRGQGSWGWTAGPEKGIQFYHVDTGRLTGVPGAYCNFAGTDGPTDRTARAVMVDASGTWIPSFTANVTSNYLLEFGGNPPVSKGSIQYNNGNQHWYQLVTSSVSWDASVTLAANTKFWDASGYLVTVTDAHEQNFLSYNFGSFFTQLGASDKDTEGVWRWSTKENTILWQNGQCVGFCLWGNGEPNDANIGEDAVNWRNQHNTIQNEWNDFPSNEIQATHYIVEFECTRETMCGGHGNCNGERCQCDSGYSGQFCRGCAPGSSATDCFAMDSSTEHGYRLIRGSYDFQTALNYAQTQYGSEAYLATITSQAENDFIRKTFGGASFWTSGADYNGQGSWSWAAGPEKPIVFYHVTDKCVAGEYCNWGSSPSNREQRALVVDGSGTWSAQPFGSTNNYLVEIGGRAPEIANPLQFNPANFHFYQYVTDVRSWYLALVTAAASQYQGTPGYLVTVNSAAEHNFLYRKFGRVNTWLGGSNQLDRGTWLWDAKENSTFYSGSKCNSFCLFADGYPTGASTDSVTGLAWTIDNTYNGWDIKKASNITLAPPGYIIEYECARATTCGGHGDCNYQGICTCDGGWTGDFCRSCSNKNETYPFCTGVPGSTTAAIQGGSSGGLSSGAIAAIVVVVVVVVLVAVALVLLKMRGVLQLQRFNRFHDKPGGGSLGSQGATAE